MMVEVNKIIKNIRKLTDFEIIQLELELINEKNRRWVEGGKKE